MKIVIFGSNGMLGTYFKKYFEKKYEVLSVTRKDIDLSTSSEKEILSYLKKNVSEGDIILNASGVIKQRTFELKDMINVNSIFPNILASFKETIPCKIIHISTDCVYSGRIGNYDENSEHDCLDEYGKTKSLGENKNLTIIRTSIIGEELSNKKSLVEWVISQSNKKIDGYTNHLWNGVTCLELSKYIDKLIVEKTYWSGVRHIHSPNTVSKYQLVSMINEVYNLNITVTEKTTKDDCFRNLTTKLTNPIEKSLMEQIVEMKNFKIS